MPRRAPAADLAPLETATLHAIARYRFVNVALLGRVVDGSEGAIRDAARRLRVLGLVGSTGPGVRKFQPGDPEARREFGNPSLFWVSVQGAAYLDACRRSAPAVPFVIGATLRPNDPYIIAHRLGIVAVHIAFRAWATARGLRGVSFLADFEPGSDGTRDATAIPYIRPNGKPDAYRPDGLLRFTDPQGGPQLMALEFERGGARHDVSPWLTDKLAGVEYAARWKLVETYKGTPAPVPFLVVFPSAAMRDRALQGWPDPAAPVWRRFFIKALPEVEGGAFGRAWWRPDGTRPDLFGGSLATTA